LEDFRIWIILPSSLFMVVVTLTWVDNCLWIVVQHKRTPLLGNSRYEIGDLVGAEQAFRKATTAHPQSGEVFNNLAHVLADLGRLR